MLGIEKDNLGQIALQVICVGGLCISLFVFDGLVDSIEVCHFKPLALCIVFESYLDIARVIEFWLARGAKNEGFDGVPTVVMDQLEGRPSIRRAYEVILFVQT